MMEGYRPGRISKLFPDRGYGFIRSKEDKDYFFHASNLQDIEFSKLTELQYVQFIVKTEAGPENNYRGDVQEVRIL